MALPINAQDRAHLPINTFISEDQQSESRSSRKSLHILPRWLRYTSLGLHQIVVYASIAIIALITHSLRGFYDTRTIKFGGQDASWPKDLNLQPAYFFVIISALSLAVSCTSSLYAFFRRNSPVFSTFEVAVTILSSAMLVLWITGDALQHRSETTPKKDVLSWSCRRKASPTNVLVSYASICNEQVRML